MANKTPAELLAEGKKRLDILRSRQNELAIRIGSARQNLKDAQVEADMEFGTSNLAQLRELFKQREESNALAVTEFTMALDDIDSALRRTEQALAS